MLRDFILLNVGFSCHLGISLLDMAFALQLIFLVTVSFT